MPEHRWELVLKALRPAPLLEVLRVLVMLLAVVGAAAWLMYHAH